MSGSTLVRELRASQTWKRVTLRSVMSAVAARALHLHLAPLGFEPVGMSPDHLKRNLDFANLSLRMSPIIGPRFAMRSFALCEKCR